MSYPQHPDTIVIKNEYYPKGLLEVDIWNYYQKVKVPLLKETLGHSLIVFFAVDVNKFTVIRKTKDDGLVRLNMRDYDTIVSGRSISFHNVMNKYSPYGVVDIDTDDFKKAKELASELYDFFENQKFVYDTKVIYTGKNSFHIRVYFNSDYKIESIKQRLITVLSEAKLNSEYTIKSRREKNIPNLDLQRNVYNAGFIAVNSLSVDGLKSIEIIEPKKIKWFRKEQSKI
jgi:hypothetical protein